MVPPLASSFLLLIKNLLRSYIYLTCQHSLEDFHLIIDFSSPFTIFFSYTFPACFSIVSNFICNFTTLPSFQLHGMHLTSREGSFSFVGGIGSINGYVEIQSGWNCLPMSHWPFFLFRERIVSPSKEKYSTFLSPISPEDAFISP